MTRDIVALAPRAHAAPAPAQPGLRLVAPPARHPIGGVAVSVRVAHFSRVAESRVVAPRLGATRPTPAWCAGSHCRDRAVTRAADPDSRSSERLRCLPIPPDAFACSWHPSGVIWDAVPEQS